MTLIDEYFELHDIYSRKYGEKTVIFLEKGMFYEIYGIDNATMQKGNASIVSNLLNIQLTRSNKKIIENGIHNPLMTGFPIQSLMKNLKIMLEHNFTVITYNQGENPNERFINSIYSPGTFIEENKNHLANYICSLYIHYCTGSYVCGVSFLELSTGESYIYERSSSDITYLIEVLTSIIESYAIAEVIYMYNTTQLETFIDKYLNLDKDIIHKCFYEKISIDYQNEILNKVFNISSQLSAIEYFDLEKMIYGTISYINVLQFCYEHNNKVLKYIADPIIHNNNDKLSLHNNAVHQLNIVSQNKKRGNITSLFDVVDNTSTPMGKRRLLYILLNPITNILELQSQYSQIEKMVPNVEWFENNLKSIIDLERFFRKMSLEKLAPIEVSNIYPSFLSIQNILMVKFQNLDITSSFIEFLKVFSETFEFDLISMFSSITDINTNIFKKGIFPDIDCIQDCIETIMTKINNECKTLSRFISKEDNLFKFEYSTKIGFHIHGTHNRCDQLQKVIKEKVFFKKDSKTKCIVTSDKINNLIDKLTKQKNALQPLVILNYHNFLKTMYLKYCDCLRSVSQFIAELDVIKSKAKTAIIYEYCKPDIQCGEKAYVIAENMRHAIIECLDGDCDYVPNDINLTSDECGILLYGVNGSGKSCYSKSIGLCIVLAQSGHYVPCTKFQYTPFTKLFTRITGDDNIFKGQSSFFVEMNELKSILNCTDDKSIVIGDEVCKGTEDISAVAIVGTTIKHLLDKGTKFIFATHLHKLPTISVLKGISSLQIKHINVTFSDTTVFTRKLVDGQGDLLYGLEIAHSILNNETFHHNAFKLRNELLNKSSKLVADKRSKYNSKLYVDHCQICGSNNNLESHHIVFQSQSNTRKNRKSNLVVLCNIHHDEVHSGKLIVSGWMSTTDGKMLNYNIT